MASAARFEGDDLMGLFRQAIQQKSIFIEFILPMLFICCGFLISVHAGGNRRWITIAVYCTGLLLSTFGMVVLLCGW